MAVESQRAAMRIDAYSLPGLGHLSAIVIDEATGEAGVVDPRRDVDLYLDAARRDGLRIAWVLETHLHNDYVSGGRDLAALTGATHVIGAGAALRYPHRPMAHHETLQLGGVAVTVLDTPGHTPEHVSYLLEPAAVGSAQLGHLLSGGSLLVGAVGRTDLLGAAQAVPYAHAMHHSLHEVILPLGDDVIVHPTHGAGSLCSTGIGSAETTTIGHERRTDPLLAPMDADAFARLLLAGQPAIPDYFARMRPMNQAGPALLGGVVPRPEPADPAEVERRVAAGAIVIDARPASAHVEAHLPGSLSIPLDDSFGTWLGWVVDLDRPVVLVVAAEADLDPLMRQAIRIGHDAVPVWLAGGVEAWRASGRPIESGRRWSPTDLAAALAGSAPGEAPIVIDVRQADEYAAGHVPGAWHINGGSLPSRLADLPRDRVIATTCAAGFRASIAASLLRAAGFERVVWVSDGFPAWEAAGLPIERGAAPGRGPA